MSDLEFFRSQALSLIPNIALDVDGYVSSELDLKFGQSGWEGLNCAFYSPVKIIPPFLPFVSIDLAAELDVFWHTAILAVLIEGSAELGLNIVVMKPLSGTTSSLEIVGRMRLSIANAKLDELSATGGIRLNRSRIIGTNIVIASNKITPELDQARLVVETICIELPLKSEKGEPLTISSDKAIFDKDGITATISFSQAGAADWDEKAEKFKGTLSASLGGFAIALQDIDITLVKNQLVNAAGSGKFMLPFFDEPLDLGLGILPGGEWSLTIPGPIGPFELGKATADQPKKDKEENEDPSKKEPGIVEMLGASAKLTVDSLTFQGAGLAIPKVAVDGKLDLTLLGRAASFPLNGLHIDAKGALELVGGWLPLPGPVSLDIGPFSATVSRLGFGSTPGGKQITVDAAVNLHEALPVGVSAKGLRVDFDDKWQVKGASFDGIGVRLVVPDIIDFAGAVAMETKGTEVSFAGAIGVDLLCIDARMDGQLAFGEAKDESGDTFRYMAIHLAMDLSSGIALFGTGLSIYGFEGLFAWNYAPNKSKNEGWYSLEGEDWFHRSPPGITALEKWAPKRGAFALGAGVTIGTTTGNGKPFNGKFLLLVTLPGPVIFLEGRANFLRDREELNKEPQFHAMAALDALAGTVQFGVDVKWRQPDKGQLIDLKGGAEAFFDYHNPSNWYLKIGKEDPTSARVQAKLLSFLQASSFMLVDSRHARFGSGSGYSASFKWGPLSAGIKVELSTIVDISWRPPQLQAMASLYGKAWFKVFGYGLTLQVNAGAQVDASRPFLLVANVGVKGKIPIYGKFSKSVQIKWTAPKGEAPPKPKEVIAPPITCPLVSISAGHRLVPTRWTFVPGETLLPAALADASGNLLPEGPKPNNDWEKAGPSKNAPVLPLDATFDLTFAFPIEDRAQVALVGAQSLQPLRVGDTDRTDKATASVRTGLQTLKLERWDGAQWQIVHQRSAEATQKSALDDKAWGVWAPPLGADNDTRAATQQQRLRLWEADPLAFVATPSGELKLQSLQSGAAAAPLLPIQKPKGAILSFASSEAPPEQASSEFPKWQPWAQKLAPWIALDDACLRVRRVQDKDSGKVLLVVQPSDTEVEYFYFKNSEFAVAYKTVSAGSLEPVVVIELSWEVTATEGSGLGEVRVQVYGSEPIVGFAFGDSQLLVVQNSDGKGGWIVLTAEGIVRVRLQSAGPFGIETIEVTTQGTPDALGKQANEAMDQLLKNKGILTAPAHVLPAWSDLRLLVQLDLTQITANSDEVHRTIEQAVCFRTEGPPRLAGLTVPSSPANPAQPDLKQALQNPEGLIGLDGLPTTIAVLSSPLNSLAPYVLQALPATPQDGESSTVWRLADVGFDLALGHVRQMYLKADSDLGIRVRHAGGAPIRDSRGLPVGVLTEGVWLSAADAKANADQEALAALWSTAVGQGLPTIWGQSTRIRWHGPILPANSGLVAELVPLAVSVPLTDSLAAKSDVPSQADLPTNRWQNIGFQSLSDWQVYGKDAQIRLVLPACVQTSAGTLPVGNSLLWLGHGQGSDWTLLRASVSLYLGGVGQGGSVYLGLHIHANPKNAKTPQGSIIALSPADSRVWVWHYGNGVPQLAGQGYFDRSGEWVRLSVVSDETQIAVLVDDEVVYQGPPRPTSEIGTVGVWGSRSSASAPGQLPGFCGLQVEDMSAQAPVALAHHFRTGQFASLNHLAATAPVRTVSQGLVPNAPPLLLPATGLLAGDSKLPLGGQPSPEEIALCAELQTQLAKQYLPFASPVGETALVAGMAGNKQRFLALRTDRLLDWRRTHVWLSGQTPRRAEPSPRYVRIVGGKHLKSGELEAIEVMPLGGGVEGPVRLQWQGIANPAWQSSNGPWLRSSTGDEPAGQLFEAKLNDAEAPLWRRGEAGDFSQSWELVNSGGAYQGLKGNKDLSTYLAPASPAADVILRVTLTVKKGSAGVVLRASAPAENGPAAALLVQWDTASNALSVTQRMRDGSADKKTKLAAPPVQGDSLRLEVMALGGDVLIFANGQLCGRHVDSAPQAGAYGVYCNFAPVAAVLQLKAFAAQSARGLVLRNRFSQLLPATWQQETLPDSDAVVGTWTTAADSALGTATNMQDAGATTLLQLVPPNGDGTAPPAANLLVQGLLRLPDLDLGSLRGDSLLFAVAVQVPTNGTVGVVVGDIWGSHVRLVVSSSTAALSQTEAGAEPTQVAEQTLSTPKGSWLTLSVRLDGQRVTGWVGQAALAACSFGATPSGGISLMGAGVPAAVFAAPCALQLARQVGPWRLPGTGAAPSAPVSDWLTAGTIPAAWRGGGAGAEQHHSDEVAAG